MGGDHASITADVAAPGVAVYSATKAAVVQMRKVMVRDWIRRGINVNMICPGARADRHGRDGGRRPVALTGGDARAKRRVTVARQIL